MLECVRLLSQFGEQPGIFFVKRHLQELLQLLPFGQRLFPRLDDPFCLFQFAERFFRGIGVVPERAAGRNALELYNARLQGSNVKDTPGGFRFFL